MKLLLGAFVATTAASSCMNASGAYSPCVPGNDHCAAPFADAPAFHLMDQHGCGENDPNGPIYDPVHGVLHHFYQIHLARDPGQGPIYGHFVSKDFVTWAALPVAIWNGVDASVSPQRLTPYDSMAIYTGSGLVVDGAGPGGKGEGVVQIYPGLCDKGSWPECTTGTLLAMAVPANYAADALLVNWTKPSFNPIVESTQRDPSTPWKTEHGEWRLTTYDTVVYGSASDADLLAGRWYTIGPNQDFPRCECPSFYPLPPPTPGFEAAYAAAARSGSLPTHVHKHSCGGGGDLWQMGTYVEGPPRTTGSFNATPGWEEAFKPVRIDPGLFYASKDNLYPGPPGAAGAAGAPGTADGKRRINWGWATVPPKSAQTLPREVTFNAATRSLEQAPIAELLGLRGASALTLANQSLAAGTPHPMAVPRGVAQQSEVLVSFALPSAATTLAISFGELGCGAAARTCTHAWASSHAHGARACALAATTRPSRARSRTRRRPRAGGCTMSSTPRAAAAAASCGCCRARRPSTCACTSTTRSSRPSSKAGGSRSPRRWRCTTPAPSRSPRPTPRPRCAASTSTQSSRSGRRPTRCATPRGCTRDGASVAPPPAPAREMSASGLAGCWVRWGAGDDAQLELPPYRVQSSTCSRSRVSLSVGCRAHTGLASKATACTWGYRYS